MSPTSILNGCMAMLIDVSSNMRAISPKIIAPAKVKLKLPAFGRRHITAIAITDPRKR